jgi:hypothetical protein
MKKLLFLLLFQCSYFQFFAQGSLNFQEAIAPVLTGTPQGITVQDPMLLSTGNMVLFAPPANDNCANAQPLTSGGACVNGTTVQATVQAGEVFGCQAPFIPTQTVWYSFVATSTQMYVQTDLLTTSGCWLGSAVYSGGCIPGGSPIACEDIANGPQTNILNLNSLVIGSTYLVQVVYQNGTACGNAMSGGATFCIKVAPVVNCNTCGSPCGPACGFATTPTVATVIATCPQYNLAPPLNAGQSGTYCYTFTAVNTIVTTGMIANTQGCSSGTVTGVSWSLYSPGCGGVIQTGTLSNTTMTGLTIGQTYTYCYTPTSACLRLSQYPYFVGAAPLPVELLSFAATVEDNYINVRWESGSELNNDHYTLERSIDGINFIPVDIEKGCGTCNLNQQYSFRDFAAYSGLSYYRLNQFDFDGNRFEYGTIAVRRQMQNADYFIYPNPVSNDLVVLSDEKQEEKKTLEIFAVNGKRISIDPASYTREAGKIIIPLSGLPAGVYYLKIIGSNNTGNYKFIKL